MFKTLDLAAALYVAQHMRAADRECLEAVTVGMTSDHFAINRHQSSGAAWAMYQDGLPVCMGGVALITPWYGLAWLVCTDVMTLDSWKKLIRHSRKVFGNARKTIPRIEAHVLSTWPEAAQYIKRLGFEHEGTRRAAGRDGQDVHVFAITGANLEDHRNLR